MLEIGIGFLPYCAVVTVALDRIMRRSSRQVVSLRWGFAQPAWLIPYVALFTGGPQWPVGVGSVECLLLMLIALRMARSPR